MIYYRIGFEVVRGERARALSRIRRGSAHRHRQKVNHCNRGTPHSHDRLHFAQSQFNKLRIFLVEFVYFAWLPNRIRFYLFFNQQNVNFASFLLLFFVILFLSRCSTVVVLYYSTSLLCSISLISLLCCDKIDALVIRAEQLNRILALWCL